MSDVTELTIDNWIDEFKPIKNHLNNNTSFDGTMFETFGTELDFVIRQNVNKIWTYVANEDGGADLIIEGYHHVNRLGYFVTEISRDTDIAYEIIND